MTKENKNNPKTEMFFSYRANPTEKLRNEIIVEYAPLVKYVARRVYMNIGGIVEIDDLEGYGIFGLIRAIDAYDPDSESGASFETYAANRIRGIMLDEIRRLDWVPRTVRSMEKKVFEFKTEYRNKYGKQPEASEIAEGVGVDVKKIYDHERLMLRSGLQSIEGMKSAKEDGSTGTDIFDTMFGTYENNPELEYLKTKDLPGILKEVMDVLTDREKEVIQLIYYEDLTSIEASKVMNISESRVSQLHSSALRKMKNAVPDGQELMSLFIT